MNAFEPKTKGDAEFEAFARSLGFIPGIAGSAGWRFVTFRRQEDALTFKEMAATQGVDCIYGRRTADGQYSVRSR